MKKIIFFIISLIFFVTGFVHAGGGRIELFVLDDYGTVKVKPVRVEAKISKPDYSGPSIGEKAEFRLINPRSGDYCRTYNNQSDSNGMIRGECGAEQAGGLTMYVHSFDTNFDTYTTFFQIHEAVKNPGIIASIVPILNETKSQPTPISTPSQKPIFTPESTDVITVKEVKDNTKQLNDILFVSKILLLIIALIILIFFIIRTSSVNNKILGICICGFLVILILVLFVFNQNNKNENISQKVVPIAEPSVFIPDSTTRPVDPSPKPTPVPSGIIVTIKGTVYNDNNCNYKFDSDEKPMPHVKVSIYQFVDTKINILSANTYGEDGKYSFSVTIQPNETIVLQPNPYRDGYSIIAMSGLPQQAHLSASARTVIQDLPMIKSDQTEKCH